MANNTLTRNVDPDEMKLFFCIFSPERGVFLGEGCWSYDRPELVEMHNAAITFRGTEKANKAVAFFKEKEAVNCTAVQVWPDLKFNLASVDACANAGLPRWEFDQKKIEKAAKK